MKFFYKNIGRRIQLLAMILAVLSLAGFLALGVYLLIAGLSSVDATLREAGIQGAVISLLLALICPLFSWIVYGLGTLIQTAERHAENDREVKDLLRQALADGALSDDISRKLSLSLSKMNLTAPSNARPVMPARVGTAPTVEQASAPTAEQTAPAASAAEEPEEDEDFDPTALIKPLKGTSTTY